MEKYAHVVFFRRPLNFHRNRILRRWNESVIQFHIQIQMCVIQFIKFAAHAKIYVGMCGRNGIYAVAGTRKLQFNFEAEMNIL